MTGAMYSAVAGLRAHMNALNVIGNNISNVNTNAYKASRYTFLESMYSNYRGGSNGTAIVGGRNPAQNGYGASLGTIDLDMSTKNFTPTGHNGDCMINGNGFFIVGNKDDEIRDSTDLKEMLLTRHGDLFFDNSGYLVDGNGKVVYGYLCTEQRVDKGTKDDPNWQTEYVGQPVLTAMRMPMLVKKECYVKTDPATGLQTVKGVADMTEDELKSPEWIHKDVGDCIYPSYQNVAAQGETTARYEFTDWIDKNKDFIDDARALVDSISIDDNSGRVTATTTTGKIVVCGYIAIAKVDNPNGVSHIDGHYYQALEGAGNIYATTLGGAVKNSEKIATGDTTGGNTTNTKPYLNADGTVPGEMDSILTAGATHLISGGLESSGTDLATEISNMITVERGYQANTRIVTVTDAMLEELINMKR